MINRNVKGAKAEDLARKWLESQGWTVHRVIRSRWHSNDVFKCDLIAMKAYHKPRFIQVTAGSGIVKKFQDLYQFPWNLQSVDVEVWRWVGGKTTKRSILERQVFHTWIMRFNEAMGNQFYPNGHINPFNTQE